MNPCSISGIASAKARLSDSEGGERWDESDCVPTEGESSSRSGRSAPESGMLAVDDVEKVGVGCDDSSRFDCAG
jgi:hypothetical protein